MCSKHCTAYSEQCKVYSEQWSLNSVKCTVSSVQFKYAVTSVQYILYSARLAPRKVGCLVSCIAAPPSTAFFSNVLCVSQIILNDPQRSSMVPDNPQNPWLSSKVGRWHNRENNYLTCWSSSSFLWHVSNIPHCAGSPCSRDRPLGGSVYKSCSSQGSKISTYGKMLIT